MSDVISCTGSTSCMSALCKQLYANELCPCFGSTSRSSCTAFAAILSNGDVIAWGDEYGGGNIPSETMEQLNHVVAIPATDHAFAALRLDGRVLAWGHTDFGGQCDHLRPFLHNIKELAGNCRAFAAITAEGRIFTWGDVEFRGYGLDPEACDFFYNEWDEWDE